MPSENKEKQDLHQRLVGWHAHKFGLSHEADEDEVMDHDRKLRAQAQNLPEDANWFRVFCAELKSGIKNPTILAFWDSDGGLSWSDDPSMALDPAREAHTIFCKEE